MTATTKRTILRWIHILFALPLIGFIYGPPAETEQYRPYFQYLYMPLVALSGLLMWKGHLLARLFGGGSK
jgi:thiosulfate reductase cytochrome b subunit